MSSPNDLRLNVFDGVTPVADPSQDLEFAENIQFSTHYPGGDFGDASLFVEMSITAPLQIKGNHRLQITGGQKVLYEGKIQAINRIKDDGVEGIEFLAGGATNTVLMKYPLEKRWCDDRITEDVWVWQTDIATYTGAEKCDLDRTARLRFTPKAVAWLLGDFVAVRYTMPTGQTIKRITWDYKLTTAAGATNWTVHLYDRIGAAALDSVSRTTAGTSSGSKDITPATPRQYLEFLFVADAAYTPPADGTVYLNLSNIKIYSETNNPITAKVIADDLVDAVSGAGYINSSKDLVETAGTQLTLEPYITQGYPSVADILNDAVGRGDGAFNRWSWGLKESAAVASPNGKPVLYIEQYPALTDWEYEVRFGEDNIDGRIELAEDFDAIANWIVLSYTDPNSNYIYITPDDDANLKDQTSIDSWGLRGVRLDCGQTTGTEATAHGRRFLATYKDMQYKLLAPISLFETVRRKSGDPVPVSWIRAGERIKLNNFLATLSGVNPVFVITATNYDHDRRTITLTAGIPGAPLGARQVPAIVSAPPDDATGGTSTSAGGGSSKEGPKQRDLNWRNRNYVKKYAKKHGIDLSKVAGRSKERDRIVKAAWKEREKK